MIVSVNRAWQDFCRDNNGDPARCGPGVSYLDVCLDDPDDEGAQQVAGAIRAALRGVLPAPIRVLVPCHSLREERWFDVLVSSWFDDQGECVGAVVTLSRVRVVPPSERQAAGTGPVSEVRLTAAMLDRILSRLFAVGLNLDAAIGRCPDPGLRARLDVAVDETDKIIRTLRRQAFTDALKDASTDASTENSR